MSSPAPRAPRPARARSLLCPNCGAPVTLRASGSTVSAVCPNCMSVLDVGTDDSLRLVAAAQERTRRPGIPIGTRGTLGGTEWEVVGFQARSVLAGSWAWEEYLLFNPFQGFRFLLHDHGEWTLYALLRRDFAGGVPDSYTMGETNRARTDYVLGEFYWRIRVGDEVQVREYLNPPLVLSEEWTDDERTWSQGERLAVAAVRTGFGLPGLPGKGAPAVAQGGTGVWTTAGVACLALLVLAAVPFGQYRNRTVLSDAFEATGAGERVLAEFGMPGRGGSLAMVVSSGFTDGPVTVQVRLLPSGGPPGRRSFTAVLAAGGALGDVADTRRAVFGAVPGGQYRLTADVDTPAFHPGTAQAPDGLDADSQAMMMRGFLDRPGPAPAEPAVVPVRVELVRHPPSNGAIMAVLLAILAWPMARGVAHWARRQRWDG